MVATGGLFYCRADLFGSFIRLKVCVLPERAGEGMCLELKLYIELIMYYKVLIFNV